MIRFIDEEPLYNQARDRKCFPRWRKHEYLVLTDGWRQPDAEAPSNPDWEYSRYDDIPCRCAVSWPSDDGEHILTPAEWDKRTFGGTEINDYATRFGLGYPPKPNEFRFGKKYEKDHRLLKMGGRLYRDPLRESWR